MSDMATEFATLGEDAQLAYAIGMANAYRGAMDACAAGFNSGGLHAAFSRIRDQYLEAVAMFSVEGTI